MKFFGPLLNVEGMQQEQNLAEQLRRIAERLETSPSRAAA